MRNDVESDLKTGPLTKGGKREGLSAGFGGGKKKLERGWVKSSPPIGVRSVITIKKIWDSGKKLQDNVKTTLRFKGLTRTGSRDRKSWNRLRYKPPCR